jgi:hypothetical protein
VLWANDSARRYMARSIGRLPGERPLAGRFESHSTAVPSLPNSYQPGTQEPACRLTRACSQQAGVSRGSVRGRTHRGQTVEALICAGAGTGTCS